MTCFKTFNLLQHPKAMAQIQHPSMSNASVSQNALERIIIRYGHQRAPVPKKLNLHQHPELVAQILLNAFFIKRCIIHPNLVKIKPIIT